MPLFDMAEAVSRGDIIVDEVDALNAVYSGKLSELETARFSPLVAEHSRRQSSGNGYGVSRAAPIPDLHSGGELNGSGAVTNDDEHTWDNVLVDEIDFVHAVQRGRISRNDLHIIRSRNSGGFVDGARDENGWNRVLVDEVDILHAVEQGARITNRSECRFSHMHRESRTTRSGRSDSGTCGVAEAVVNNELEIARTNDARLSDGNKQ